MNESRPAEARRPATPIAKSTPKAKAATSASGCQRATNDQGSSHVAPAPKNLPEAISERLALVFERERLSPQKSRLLKYIFRHPDAWTHEIAANAAVGYPPNRLGELNKEVLPKYGLALNCHRPEQWLTNRYGDESKVHQWRLVLQPLQGREAA